MQNTRLQPDMGDPVTYNDPAPAGGGFSLAPSSSGATATRSRVASAAGLSPVNSGILIAPGTPGGIAWGPSYPVPDGAVVEAYPRPGNTKSVYIGQGDPDCFLIVTANLEIAPGANMIVYPVRNLADLLVKNQVKDEGVVVRVRSR